MKKLKVEPLTQAAFAPFGDVLEVGRTDHPSYPINNGFTQRFHALSAVSARGEGVILSIFETRSFGLPLTIDASAQAGFFVVVAEGKDAPDPGTIRAFAAEAGQGVNFAAGVWHHPNIVKSGAQQFLVVDRADPATNLEEFYFPADWEDIVLEG